MRESLSSLSALSALSSLLTVPVVLALLLIHVIHLAVRRLYLSPIAAFPGPRLAAVSWWYEFYYDIILGGQYTFKIIELHKQYGPIIRINPDELHIADPDFWAELFGSVKRRREKWSFYTQQFAAPGSALCTEDHDLHRLRRAAMDHFFSKQDVRKMQPIIDDRVKALLHRLRGDAEKSGLAVDLMYPFSAFTHDVIVKYAFDRDDLLTVTDSFLSGTHMGQSLKHMNWLLTLLNLLPDRVSSTYIPGWREFLKMRRDISGQIVDIQAAFDKGEDGGHSITLFHSLLDGSLLPPPENNASRVAQEGQILVQAGTLTASWTLAVATFHLLDKVECLTKVRDELFAAMPNPHQVAPLAHLENLPYLRAVVKESLRLAHGTSSRLPRSAPDETLVLHDARRGKTWRIPPGTPVNMTPYQTLTDASIFPDPFAFHPERWLEAVEDGTPRLDRYLVVFAGGPRGCLGRDLAQAEIYLMLAGLFRRWGAVPVGGGPAHARADSRPGDVGYMSLVEGTTVRDCEMAADYFIPIPYKGSKGIRVRMEVLV